MAPPKRGSKNVKIGGKTPEYMTDKERKLSKNKSKRKNSRKKSRTKSMGDVFKSFIDDGMKTAKKAWKPFKSNSTAQAGTAHAGWLYKKLNNGKWKKCWFVLDGSSLSHYEHSTKRKGSDDDAEIGMDLLAEGERFVVNLSLVESVGIVNERIIEISLKDNGGKLELRAPSKKHAKVWYTKVELAKTVLEAKIKKMFEKQLRAAGETEDKGFSLGMSDVINAKEKEEPEFRKDVHMNDFSMFKPKSIKEIRDLKKESTDSDDKEAITRSVNKSKSVYYGDEIDDESVIISDSDEDENYANDSDDSEPPFIHTYMKPPAMPEKETRAYKKRRGRETMVRKVSQIVGFDSDDDVPRVRPSEFPRDGVMPIFTKKRAVKDLEKRQDKDEPTMDLLLNTIQNASTFVSRLVEDTDSGIIKKLVENMYQVQVKRGQYLIREGDLDDKFFIVAIGRFNILKRTEVQDGKVFIDEKKQRQRIIATKGRGAFLGELALLYDQTALVSVRSLGRGVVWALSRDMFKKIKSDFVKERQAEKFKFLDSISVLDLSKGSENDILAFADALEYHSTIEMECLVDWGTKLNRMFFVAKGTIRVYSKDDELLHHLEKGDSFGELALVEEYVSDYKLYAGGDNEPTVYFSLDVSDFQHLIPTLKEALHDNFGETDTLTSLERTKSMNKVMEEQVKGKYLENSMESMSNMTDQEIILQTLKRKGKGKGKKKADNRAKKGTVVYTKGVGRDGHDHDLDDKIVKSFEYADMPGKVSTRMSTLKTGMLNLQWKEAPPLVSGIDFDDLKSIKKLGAGAFGAVNLVRHETDKRYPIVDTADSFAPRFMALKSIPRAAVVQNGWEKQIKCELSAMKELSYHKRSPFLLKCFHTFTDHRNIYMLIELCEGGDIFNHIGVRPEGLVLTEMEARFYTACVINGLEAMHESQIIYRDLKPENLMISSEGYLKIADFGFAKKAIRSFTICGTSDYMAPEIILARGQGETVDYWALGILIYEFTNGVVPFSGRTAMTTYEQILEYHSGKAKIEFRNPYMSEPCKKIIKKLLAPKSVKRYYRLGESIESYRIHPFFTDFDWHELDQEKMPAPFVPLPQHDIFEDMPEMRKEYLRKDLKPLDDDTWQPNVDTVLF